MAMKKKTACRKKTTSENKCASRSKKTKTESRQWIIADGGSWVEKKAPKTKKIVVDGKTYDIPVDKDGFVSESSLIMRFAQVDDGDRDDRTRSVNRDLDKTASKTLKLGDKIRPEEIAAWWAHPNESDIIGIDDENTRVFTTEGATRKSSLPYQRKIGIVGTPSERRQVRKALDECFTAGELKKLTADGSVYVFASDERKNLSGNASGYYSPSDGMIVIRKGATSGTIVHETVHRLRHKDTGRTGKFTSSKVNEHARAAKDNPERAHYLRAVEEAGTECETVARMSPFSMNGKRTSYYGALARDPDGARKLMAEDRKLLVGNADPDKKGLKGKKAVSSVEKNFTKTHISSYGYGGEAANKYDFAEHGCVKKTKARKRN